jgi:hypothetical protein
MYSPSHHQACTPVIKAQSKLHFTANLCKDSPLAMLFACISNSCPVSTSQISVCIHILLTTWRRWFGERSKIIETAVNAACHRFNSAVLSSGLNDRNHGLIPSKGNRISRPAVQPMLSPMHWVPGGFSVGGKAAIALN